MGAEARRQRGRRGARVGSPACWVWTPRITRRTVLRARWNSRASWRREAPARQRLMIRLRCGSVMSGVLAQIVLGLGSDLGAVMDQALERRSQHAAVRHA